MDAGYAVDTDLRTSITALGLSYVAGIQPRTTVWGTWPGRVGQRGGRVMGDHCEPSVRLDSRPTAI
jgi:hypothetical protein